MTDRRPDEPDCIWTGKDTPRAVRGQHEEPLPEDHPDHCRGCARCPRRHCAIDGHVHLDDTHPLTCPSCVGEVRDDLRLVADMHARLLTQAVADASSPIPGGDAMVLLGPGSPDSKPGALDESYADPVPPLLILEGWAMVWRDELGHRDPTEKATVGRACRYLAQQLSLAAQRGDCDLPTMAAELRQLVRRLESVLHDGERDERGAPCIDCGATLVRQTAPPKRTGSGDQGGLRDVWDCPRCKRRYGYAEYHRAVAAEYRRLSPVLTAADLVLELEVKAGTLRSWVARGKVARRGTDQYGRALYDVEQARAAQVSDTPSEAGDVA